MPPNPAMMRRGPRPLIFPAFRPAFMPGRVHGILPAAHSLQHSLHQASRIRQRLVPHKVGKNPLWKSGESRLKSPEKHLDRLPVSEERMEMQMQEYYQRVGEFLKQLDERKRQELTRKIQKFMSGEFEEAKIKRGVDLIIREFRKEQGVW